MNEYLPFALLGLASACLVWALLSVIFSWFRARRIERQIRLDDAGTATRSRAAFFEALTTVAPSRVAATDSVQNDLIKDLRMAGYYRPMALVEYTAMRAVLVLMVVLITGAFAWMAQPEQFGTILMIGSVATLLAFSLPRIVVSSRARARRRKIERGIPLAIDLLTLCLSAGQNLVAALAQVSRELRLSNPELAEELAIAHQQANLHSLEAAMKQWSDRAGSEDVNNLSLVLIQSQRLGTDAAGTLQELADNYRRTTRQRADAQANRASFWILFPSVFCFWIAAAIILIGPPYVDFFQQRTKSAAAAATQTKKNLEKANSPNRKAPGGSLIPGALEKAAGMP